MPFWNKKDKKEPEDPILEMIRRMQEEMEKSMQAFMSSGFAGFDDEMPRMDELMKKTKGKPMIYGVSFTVGPNGKPLVEQFGNVEPEQGEVKPEREPLVDVIHKEKEISVLAELPGVDKNEVTLNITPDKKHLEINAPTKFYKKLKLPAPVKPDVSKATYKNGILEVTLQKEKPSAPEKGTNIPIE